MTKYLYNAQLVNNDINLLEGKRQKKNERKMNKERHDL